MILIFNFHRCTGRCVPFDWVSFCSLLLHNRFDGLIKCETRQLYVGEEDPSVMVLLEPGEWMELLASD